MLLRSTLAIGTFTALMDVAANIWQFFAFRARMGTFTGFTAAVLLANLLWVYYGCRNTSIEMTNRRLRYSAARGAVSGARWRVSEATSASASAAVASKRQTKRARLWLRR